MDLFGDNCLTFIFGRCGYTESNYKGLKELYAKHNAAGFEVRF